MVYLDESTSDSSSGRQSFGLSFGLSFDDLEPSSSAP